jgi:hypothetical protein
MAITSADIRPLNLAAKVNTERWINEASKGIDIPVFC